MKPKTIVIHECKGDMVDRWAKSICKEQREEYEHDQDIEIERELGPWPSRDGWTEEADVEMVAVEAMEEMNDERC